MTAAAALAYAGWAGAGIWAAVLLLPWRPYGTRERLEAAAAPADLRDVAVVIPARNEAAQIERVLEALTRQGPGLEVRVLDDESTDGTGEICRRFARTLAAARGSAPSGEGVQRFPLRLEVETGRAVPPGWAGKLWALEQGAAPVDRPFVLLLDADIELAPCLVPALLERARSRRAVLVSCMATLACTHFWERLLVPAFIFFFKLLYPFALVESGHRAGAAGGCMLVETAALRGIGGFAALRDALIDDCTLAARLRRQGGKLSLSMSRSVRSLRGYARLGDFWAMVARSAFTQLGYSTALLALTTLVMLTAFFGPLAAAAAAPTPAAAAAGLVGYLCMCGAYMPVVRFYGLGPAWTAALPAAAALFLAMTWSSALNYWRGTRAQWKERSYEASAE